MTAAEEIASGLGAATDGLDAARTQIAAAVDHAERVREQALAHGWIGIADGMQEIVDRLGEVRTTIGRASDATDAAARPVGEIDARTNPAEVRQHLAGAVEKIGEAGQAVDVASGVLDDAESAIARSLDGGDPSQLLGLIDEARQRLTSARQQLEQARAKAGGEIQEAAQAGN